MSHFRLSRQADARLDYISDHIARDDPAAAIRVLDTLLETFQSLAANPSLGNRRDDLRPGLFVFSPRPPAHNYVICYYEIRNGIEIGHIFHGSQNWLDVFG